MSLLFIGLSGCSRDNSTREKASQFGTADEYAAYIKEFGISGKHDYCRYSIK